MREVKADFQNTALVTGASEGIGREFSKILAAKGHDLVIIARNETRLEELRKELTDKHGVSVKVIIKDLSKTNAVDEIWDEIQRDSIKITMLINNAGYAMCGSFSEMDIDAQMGMVQVCVNSLTRLMNYCLKEMIKDNKGKILNVSSVAGYSPCTGLSLYGASKAYVLMMSEAVAEEISGSNVTVTALCPGPTDSLFFKRSNSDKKTMGKISRMKPSEVAQIGYNAMTADKRTVIPGLMNKIAANQLRMIPLSLAAKAARLLT